MTSSRMFYVVSSRKQMISVLLLTITAGISALKDVRVNIPQAAKVHETITLQCHYDLEGDPLYTVKWYKGQREFFRYIPKELPSTQIFPFLGMEIDIGKSNPYNVVLRNVQQNMTGKYSCEVSSDAPDFYTILSSGYMYVIDPPTGEPEITIEKSTYEIGDTLRGNCTSPLSYPAINLTWYFNGKKVNESFRTHITDANSVSDKRKPVVTVVGLELEIDGGTFHAAKAVLRCSANLFNLYQSQMEIVLEEERPRPRPSSVLGTRDAVSGSSVLQGFFLINAVVFLPVVIR